MPVHGGAMRPGSATTGRFAGFDVAQALQPVRRQRVGA